MEKEKINSVIAGFIRNNLSPKNEEKKMISDKYEQICGLLVGNEIFQNGSYARFTSTTPVNDLDIIWVIPRSIIDEKLRTFGLSEKAIDPSKLQLSDILTDLAEKLKKEYKKIDERVTIKPQTHSVGIYFGAENEFSIDVVPAIKSGDKNEYKDDIYLVPEDKDDDDIIWIKSDPKGYIKEAQILNDKNDSFRKVAKFVKKWKGNNKKNNEQFPLKSFHIEAIVKEIMSNGQSIGVYDILSDFFTDLDFYISEPRLKDRANPQGFVDDYVADFSEKEIKLITDAQNQALGLLDSLNKCNSEVDVEKRIKEILLIEKSLSGMVTSICQSVALVLNPPSWQKPLPWPKVSTHKINIRCLLDGIKEIAPKELLFPNHNLKFVSEYSGPYEEIYWQVVNTGEQAMKIGEHALRGNYFKAKKVNGNPSETPFVNWEQTAYHGTHWIACFAVQGGRCVAVSEPFYVNIFNRSYRSGYKRQKRR